MGRSILGIGEHDANRPDELTSAIELRAVEFPLVRCAHDARPAEEMTPERVATVLSDEETRGAIAR